MLLAVGSLVAAAEVPVPQAPPPMDAKTAAEIASYGIGQQIGDNFKSEGVDVNVDQLILGLKDVMQGQKPRYTDAQLQAAFQAFSQAVQSNRAQRNAAIGEQNKRAGQAFLAANSKKPGVQSLPSGLQYQVIQAAQTQGPTPKATDTVRVNYEGKLLDGKVFDSSLRSGQPVSFQVNGVIPGWTEALQLMRVGDKWRLFVPSDLAYGANGAGNVIAPHSVLVFDVELLGIESQE
jgi:FKBP-type peptidyl-prolyl cis-trans isomerase FklB